MKRNGAYSIIIDSTNSRILLYQRKDWKFWDLPGGQIEPAEEPAQTAVREAKEETGLEIKIIKLIGDYYNQARDAGSRIFLAQITSGAIIQNSKETQAVRWFAVNKLPLWTMPGLKMFINDWQAHAPAPAVKTFSTPVVAWLEKILPQPTDG